MGRRTRADKNYKFTEKKHSGLGAAALVLAFFPLLLFFYAVAVSYRSGGDAAQTIGCVGVAAMLLAIFTLWIEVREIKKETVYKRVPVSGAVLSVLMLAGWAGVYVLGWVGL